MKRLVAVLGAVAMIGAAVLIRGALTSDGGGGGGGGAGDDGETHLICATELEAACTALAEEDDSIAVTVEDVGVTAARLVDPAFDPTADDQEFDGWLTLKPWPDLVDLRRDQAGDPAVLGEQSEVLATSKLAMVGPAERITLLQTACRGADQLGWNCLGDIAADQWTSHGGTAQQGKIEVGHDDPTASATGLLVLGQAASDYFETTDFATNDIEFDDEFRPWLRRLENADPNLPLSYQNKPVIEQLELPIDSWDAVGTLDPAARASKSRSAGDLTVLYPSPMIRAEVVLAPIRGHEVAVDDAALTAALDDAGWDPGGVPQDAPAAPSAGVYEALIQEWEQADR